MKKKLLMLLFLVILTACQNNQQIESKDKEVTKEETIENQDKETTKTEIPTWIQEHAVEEWKNENKEYFSKRPTIGKNNAPIVIAQMSNFTCNACEKWHKEIYPWAKEEYIDKGFAQMTYINTPYTDEVSLKASYASLSIYKQNEAAFWNYYEMYKKGEFYKDNEIPQSVMWEIIDKIEKIDKTTVENDVQSETYQPLLEEDSYFAFDRNLKKIPTFYVNGYRLDYPFDKEKIKEFFDELERYENQKKKEGS